MENHKPRIALLAGLVLTVLGAAGCNKQPAEDNSPPVVPPRTPGGPKMGAAAPTTAPATGASPAGQGVRVNRPPQTAAAGKAAKPGKKGQQGGAAIAKGGGDPFAPGAGRPGGAPGAQPGAAAKPAAPRMIVYAGRRTDPFYVNWMLPVPPPYVFDEVEPIRLASEAVETPPVKPYEVREQPEMRVSGIMTGDGVFAILESGGNKVDVVKPGSTVDVSVGGQTNRTYKVVSITKDKVRLRSQVGNIIYTQEVPLSDVAVGSPARGGGPGGPAAPGGFGGGMRPGGSGGPGGGRQGGPGGGRGTGGGASLGGA